MELANFAQVTRKMNKVLFDSGARLDAMYFCPHHPEWENRQKLNHPKTCFCRKPEPGLLIRACNTHGIRPNEAIMIGDTTKDFEASQRFGCFSIGVRTGHGGRDGSFGTEPNLWHDDLASAVEWLLDLEKIFRK